MHEKKDIFVDAFEIKNINEQTPIIDQLVHNFEKDNNDDLEANGKLMRWSEKKFETKVFERVSTEIAIKKVELSTLIHYLDEVIKNVHSFYKIIYYVELFTK